MGHDQYHNCPTNFPVDFPCFDHERYRDHRDSERNVLGSTGTELT